jgi:hypothetical protein
MASTVDRVPQNTANDVNSRLRKETDDRVRWMARNPANIDSRLRELDDEWDIERLLETNASAFAFVGILLGTFVDRLWLILPGLVTLFLFQHAVQGWCPPLPVLRRLGYRTSREIGFERNALKMLRGDYAAPVGLDAEEKAEFALSAARR